jgi:hypothetical protein
MSMFRFKARAWTTCQHCQFGVCESGNLLVWIIDADAQLAKERASAIVLQLPYRLAENWETFGLHPLLADCEQLGSQIGIWFLFEPTTTSVRGNPNPPTIWKCTAPVALEIDHPMVSQIGYALLSIWVCDIDKDSASCRSIEILRHLPFVLERALVIWPEDDCLERDLLNKSQAAAHGFSITLLPLGDLGFPSLRFP